MDKKEITETLAAALVYVHSLRKLNSEIQNAEEQIKNTALEAEKKITNTFSSLLDQITQVLNKRKEKLLSRAQKIMNEGLSPLKESRLMIGDKIEATAKLINLGESILQGKCDNITEFNSKSSLLGSLPEVPELKEVPYITFHHDAGTETEMTEMCSHFGSVSRIAPVQISNTMERPGAILIEWQTIDTEDRLTDIQEFRLQRAFGDVVKEPHLTANFIDCYKGLDTQFLVKDLQPKLPYSFQVCCKFEGSSEWSSWSLPQVTSTTLKPYCWKANEDYVMFDDNRIAQSAKDRASVLFSDGPQFRVGYSIDFTFLDVSSECFTVGLLLTNKPEDLKCLSTLTDDSLPSFLVRGNGEIFVDGTKKATQLPAFKTGMKVSFTCDSVKDSKVRVNIDSSDKRVTYEWQISKEEHLYFVASFDSAKSKVMVE